LYVNTNKLLTSPVGNRSYQFYDPLVLSPEKYARLIKYESAWIPNPFLAWYRKDGSREFRFSQ